MTKDTILEYLTLQRMARKMADHLTVNTAESIAIGDPKGRNTSDPAYHMITKTHGSYRKERDEKRKDIWAHTQSLHYLGKKVAEPSQPIQQQQKPSQQPPPQQQEPSPPTSEVEQKDGPDVKILQFHDIAPYHLRPNSSLSSAFQLYRQQEALYWQEMYTVPSDIRVSRKIEGVESTALSPNHRLLALGSVHGDIFVYDLWYDPPRVIRLIHNEGTSGDPVINIVWSMDALQLITLNES
uniref:Uncharacterized protein LOC102800471 n=1 Tax=Saccoglossus kowalevskii TaxID=10224 RepID=A0ABM0M4F6_SACKO